MIHDLDRVLISPRIEAAWIAYLPIAVRDLQQIMPDVTPSEIPDEQLQEFTDGSAEIFVIIRGRRLKIAVPANEWRKI